MPPIRRLIALLWPAGVMYLGYVICRLCGVKGATDIDGISAVMRIVFLSFGGSVAFFMTLLADRDRFPIQIRSGMWHNLTAWALAMIADDAFMIHETIGFHLDIKDSIPMLMLGVWLLIILAIHRNRMVRGFWYCFGVFLVLSWIAIFGDVVTGKEGTFHIGDFEFDYEMVCEVAAVLALMIGLAIQAVCEVFQPPDPEVDEDAA